jgi:triacylglycerol lipase
LRAGLSGLQSPYPAVSRLRLLAALLLVALLAGCATLPNRELEAIGSELAPDKVDFAAAEPYAARSKAAYKSEADIRTAFPKTVRVAIPANSDVQYFIEQDDSAKTQTITVRGTANKINLDQDLEIKIREDRQAGIPVHAGFDEDAKAVLDDVRPFLKPGYTISVTGHSLGGAVAALLGVYLIEEKYKVAKVVTFGQPRFTTAAGVAKLGFLPLTRYVDENDIIPLVPPSAISDPAYGPYEHVGPEIILLDGPYYVFLPKHDATRISIGDLGRNVNLANLQDHKIDKYIARTQSKVPQSTQVPYDEREKYATRPARKVAAD